MSDLDDVFVEEGELEELEGLIENKFLKITSKMVNKGLMSDQEAGEINKQARKGRVDEATELLEDVVEDYNNEIQFKDDEIQKFSDQFSETLSNLEKSIEDFRNELKSLEKGISRGDLKQYLYGAKASRTHKEVDAFFDSIDSISSGGLSDRKIAKLLSAFTTELNISELEKLVSEMREVEKNE